MLVCEIPEFIQDNPIHTLSPESTAKEAMDIMDENNIGAIPVLDGDTLVGIFSERDLIRRVFARGLDPKTTKMIEVMTSDPDTLSLDEDINKAIDMMAEGGYRHMLLVDQRGNFTGILSQRDFMKAARLELLRFKAMHKGK